MKTSEFIRKFNEAGRHSGDVSCWKSRNDLCQPSHGKSAKETT